MISSNPRNLPQLAGQVLKQFGGDLCLKLFGGSLLRLPGCINVEFFKLFQKPLASKLPGYWQDGNCSLTAYVGWRVWLALGWRL